MVELYRRPHYALSAAALAMAQRWARQATPPIPEPRRPKPKAIPKRVHWISNRRQRFIDDHNQNAMNFLPGAVVHGLYKQYKNPEREAERILLSLIAKGYRPKPGFTPRWQEDDEAPYGFVAP